MLREQVLNAVGSKIRAEIDCEVANLDVLLSSLTSMSDHTDIVGTIEAHLDRIAELEGRRQALEMVSNV